MIILLIFNKVSGAIMSGNVANLAQLNFGEDLVDQIFQKLIEYKSEKTINYYKFNESLKDFELVKGSLNQLFCKSHGTNLKIFLKIGENKIPMDGMHRVDLCLEMNRINSNDKVSFPIEIKLGVTGGAKSFPSRFIRQWRNPKDGLELYNIKNSSTNLFRGNMILVLDSDNLNDRRTNESGSFLNFEKIIHNNFNESELEGSVDNSWGLVIRKQSILSSNKVLPPVIPCKTGFNKLKYVFIFEELWSEVALSDQDKIILRIKSKIDKEFNDLNNYLKQ